MTPKFRQNLIHGLPFIGDFNNSLFTMILILLGVRYTLSPSQIGLITASYGISYLISSPIIGKIGDDIKRKTSLHIATIGQTILAITYFLIFFSQLEAQVYFILALSGQIIRAIIYAFYWPALEAYLSEIAGSSEKAHQKSISWFCISWSLGAALGANLGGIVIEYNYKVGLGIIFLFYCVSSFIVFYSVKTIHIESENSESARKNIILPQNQVKSPYSSQTLKIINLILLAGTLVFAISSNGIMGYFPNYAAVTQGLNLRGTIIGLLAFIYGFARFLAFLLGHKLPITTPTLIISMLLLGFCIPLYGIFQNLVILAGILFLGGFCAGRIYYISLELTLKYESHQKGKRAGIFESIVGLGSGITPVFSGFLAEINFSYPFYIFGGFIILMGVFGLILWYSSVKINQ